MWMRRARAVWELYWHAEHTRRWFGPWRDWYARYGSVRGLTRYPIPH